MLYTIRVQTCNIPCNKLLLLLKTNNIPLRGNKDVIQGSHIASVMPLLLLKPNKLTCPVGGQNILYTLQQNFFLLLNLKQNDIPRKGTKHVIYLATEFLSVTPVNDIPQRGTNLLFFANIFLKPNFQRFSLLVTQSYSCLCCKHE